MNITEIAIAETLKQFLAEDLGYGDLTTDALVEPSLEASGDVICKEPAVIAGLMEAKVLLQMVGCTGTSAFKDGSRTQQGAKMLRVSGPAGSILKVERPMLNLLSHMSGVATATSELVTIAKKASGGKTRIACTRKTLPGLRYFEKKAVVVAGGDAHRLRLDDEVLIKDNHLAVAGTITDCVKTARANVSFTRKIEVEVRNSQQAIEAAQAGADIVLLDNMKPNEIESAVSILREKGLREKVVLEASGGIRKENLHSFAVTGVDVISVGAITHSAKSIDMSLEIVPAAKRRK